MPLELEKNIFDKVTSFFSFLTFKDATKIFLTNNNFVASLNVKNATKLLLVKNIF